MELSDIFSFILFVMAIIASYIGIDTYNSCGGSANKDIRTQKNYAFLQAIATGTAVIGIYNIFQALAPKSSWPGIFLLLMVCIAAITTASMSKEIQKTVCSKDDKTDTNTKWLNTIIGISVVVLLITIYLKREDATKNFKGLKSANVSARVVNAVESGVSSAKTAGQKVINSSPLKGPQLQTSS